MVGSIEITIYLNGYMNINFTDFINQIAEVCKFDPSLLNYIQLVRLGLERSYYKLVREGKILEAIFTNVQLLGSNLIADKFLQLPDDLIELTSVRYKQDGGREWILADYNKDRIPPAPIYGKPTSYKFGPHLGDDDERNPSITVDPIDAVESNDLIIVDGKFGNQSAIDPESPSFFVTHNNAQIVKDDVIQFILIYQGKLDATQLYQKALMVPLPPEEAKAQ